MFWLGVRKEGIDVLAFAFRTFLDDLPAVANVSVVVAIVAFVVHSFSLLNLSLRP